MKYFKTERFRGGSIVNPIWFDDYDTAKCKKCDVKPEFINERRERGSTMTDRGRLNIEYCYRTMKCPECGTEEEFLAWEHETDGNYYSNEERRAYRNYD